MAALSSVKTLPDLEKPRSRSTFPWEKIRDALITLGTFGNLSLPDCTVFQVTVQFSVMVNVLIFIALCNLF